MDKPSERKAPTKKSGDTDVGTTRDFGAGGKRETLNSLGDHATFTGGSMEQRLFQRNYCKLAHADHAAKSNDPQYILESLLSGGSYEPNVCKPKRVF